MSSYYNDAVYGVRLNNTTLEDKRSTYAWISDLRTRPMTHIKECGKGFLGNRVRFLAAGIESAVNFVAALAFTVASLFKAVICSPLFILSLVVEFNKADFCVRFKELAAPSEWAATPFAICTAQNFLRTINSVIGVCVPVLAYGFHHNLMAVIPASLRD